MGLGSCRRVDLLLYSSLSIAWYDLVDADGKPMVNTPENEAVLEFMVKSIEDGTFDPSSITYDDRQMLNVYSQGKYPLG